MAGPAKPESPADDAAEPRSGLVQIGGGWASRGRLLISPTATEMLPSSYFIRYTLALNMTMNPELRTINSICQVQR